VWGIVTRELRIAEEMALPVAAAVACVLTFLANRNRTGPP